MSLLSIPQPVDDALGALASHRGLARELAAPIQSIARHVLRAFSGGSAPSVVEIDKVYARIEQCLIVLAANPSTDTDGTLAGDLKRLAEVIVAASRTSAPPPAPSASTAGPQIEPPPLAPAQPARASFQARPPAAAKAAAAVTPPKPSIVVGAFADSLAAHTERDWYWFVLDEVNGLGTLLQFQRQEGEAAAAARTEERVRVTLETLGWDTPAALRQTWAFVEQRMRDADDAWGPHLVLSALEPAADRLRDWRSKLPVDMQTTIERTTFEIGRETP